MGTILPLWPGLVPLEVDAEADQGRVHHNVVAGAVTELLIRHVECRNEQVVRGDTLLDADPHRLRLQVERFCLTLKPRVRMNRPLICGESRSSPERKETLGVPEISSKRQARRFRQAGTIRNEIGSEGESIAAKVEAHGPV